MTIPTNLVAPLFTFDVQSGGAFSSETKAIILAHGLAAGSLGEGEIALCTSKTEARNLAGRGSMLETMFIGLLRNAPTQQIYLARVADSGTAEIRTITIGTPPAAGGQGVLQIAGNNVSVELSAGMTANDLATALAAATNDFYDEYKGYSLPFTATAATNVVTLTARHKGTYATDIDVYVPVLDRVNAFSGLFTFATTTAGAGAPDLSDIIAAMNDDMFEIIISAFGDAANVALLKDFLNEDTGRWSYAQQLYGHAFYPFTGTSAELVAKAALQDNWHVTNISMLANGGNATPEYLRVACVVGTIAEWLGGGSSGDVSRNQTGLVVQDVAAPRDRAYWMDYATRNVLLKNGVSTLTVDGSGDVTIDKIITQGMTTDDVPDTTFRDIQVPYQLTYALKKFRADLASEHGNKAIADDNPGNLDAISTVKDIKATLYHSAAGMPGVIENPATFLSNLVVTRDSENANRVNASLKIDVVNPLDIFAGVAKIYSQIN
ncbi:phage tail sheath subtilisin-like domain-containing protein [Martelella sp. HB161492]|uniref:phage tail sheath subtilisin-like domain-containing protein n=1 Tax=Martelella sp. HB161492 TaxID=2720726 RepID=UPI0015906C62|nr:phage tail sheath subtilisin-like domain-containing protein [Martelella sp. HB161492]